MSMLVHILRVQASRRAERRKTRAQWESAALSPNAIRSRRHRRILAAILVTIGVIAFVEVVLLPGTMIRRNLVTEATSSATVAEDDHEIHLPFGLLTDEQRANLRQQKLDRVEQQLRFSHRNLGNACMALQQAQTALNEYARSKLNLDPASQPSAPIPANWVDVIAGQTTAQTAWAQLFRSPRLTEARLRDARELLDVVSGRLSARSFLPDDDRDMRSVAQQLEETRLAITHMQVCVDHLVILQRARASLVRQQSSGVQTRRLP